MFNNFPVLISEQVVLDTIIRVYARKRPVNHSLTTFQKFQSLLLKIFHKNYRISTSFGNYYFFLYKTPLPKFLLSILPENHCSAFSSSFQKPDS